jgi:cyanophycin synthetase
MLDSAGVPVPKGVIIYNEDELKEAVEEIGYPLVTKPLDGNQGKGASINITQWKDAESGFKEAQRFAKGSSKAVIVEKYIQGFDYRMLVINGKFVAAAKRTPASVTGDGKSTIKQLIDEVNKDPRRGIGHEKELTQIHLDKDTYTILENRNLTLESVIPKGEVLYLKNYGQPEHRRNGYRCNRSLR